MKERIEPECYIMQFNHTERFKQLEMKHYFFLKCPVSDALATVGMATAGEYYHFVSLWKVKLKNKKK